MARVPARPPVTGFAVRLTRGRGLAAVARGLTRCALEARAVDSGTVEDAALVVSELITNVLEHTLCEPLLVVVLHGGGVRLEVRDADARLPVSRTPPPSAPHGRGMALVAAVSHRHGVRRLPGGGKAVWAVLVLPPARRGHGGP
ncbi:ATP-binding protein [Streptomyces sp. NPDC058157]|uniref:ATP-binding protein n=1 Tax=Streptomyces sp. NPDC058157 TaxID=3346360 RepID=UPI0036ECA882